MKRDLRAELLARVAHQLEDGIPPEAAEAVARMRRDGRTEAEARNFVAAALLAEMHAMARDGRAFDPAGYAAALRALPRILKR